MKKQVHEERPQEFAPPQQYNWMMPSMRQTPKKKSKFASTESCDDTLNTSKQPQEFAPPSNSAKYHKDPTVTVSDIDNIHFLDMEFEAFQAEVSKYSTWLFFGRLLFSSEKNCPAF
mgnify:CR=1 FL=1